ncbi:hypothetical protein [Sabulibacter ruber]|uniref:hypothetical protein n=1 Tax=Sabulibacter ruber TaxID=2811901 RepID=UPI001A962A03|nr:hypothetical protein [Sabulibacter ruber]
MKKINTLFFWMMLCAGFALSSCEEESYLTDEGVHSNQTSLSTYDYLKQHPWQMFDTLLMVVDHYGLKEEINRPGTTFFAPSDFSIRRYILLRDAQVKRENEANTYTLADMYQDVTADSIRQYLFTGTHTLATAKESPQALSSLGNTPCAIRKIQNINYNQWSGAPVYFLNYIKVRGELDVPGVPVEPNDPNLDRTVLVQTSDIQSGSGGTLHVLVNTHTFVRF